MKYKYFLPIFIIIIFSSCSDNTEDKITDQDVASQINPKEYEIPLKKNGSFKPMSNDSSPKMIKQSLKPTLINFGTKKYKAKLFGTKEITGYFKDDKFKGKSGTLRVWIGDKKYLPKTSDKFNAKSNDIILLSKWVKIKPHGFFHFTPQISQCKEIDPTGTDIEFEMEPKEYGKYEASATIYYYDKEDCSDTPKTKKPDNELNIQVTTNVKEKIIDTFTQELLNSIEIVIGLLFAIPIFLLRKKIKRLFGFDKED